jgi:hypothetical protein
MFFLIIVLSFGISLVVGIYQLKMNKNIRSPFIYSICLNLFILGIAALYWNQTEPDVIGRQLSVAVYQTSFFLINIVNFLLFILIGRKIRIRTSNSLESEKE